jgi:Dehydrogenases (flavoproteins)
VLGSCSSAGKAKDLLEKFVSSHFTGAAMQDLHCGGVPAGKWLKPLVKDGAMVVGDAARQVISLTGAGINYSVYAGQLAGKIAAEAFHNGDIDYRHLLHYEKIWAKGLGKQQLRSYALKTLLIKKHDDKYLDAIAKSLSKKDQTRMSILEVFLRTFTSNPMAFLKALLLFR